MNDYANVIARKISSVNDLPDNWLDIEDLIAEGVREGYALGYAVKA
jgi:hypothetical protein